MKRTELYMGHDAAPTKVDFILINNDHGNRTWQAACGCIMTSGAGAYGSAGSARQIDRCPRHAFDADGNLIND